jgi:hypothetical protein
LNKKLFFVEDGKGEVKVTMIVTAEVQIKIRHKVENKVHRQEW